MLPAPVEGANTAEVVAAAFAGSSAELKIPSAGSVDAVLLVDAWFRKYPEERQRTDGGNTV